MNSGRVPSALQEPLMSAVGALGEQAPVCLPSVTTTAPPASTTTSREPAGKKHHGDEKERKHGKGHEK